MKDYRFMVLYREEDGVLREQMWLSEDGKFDDSHANPDDVAFDIIKDKETAEKYNKFKDFIEKLNEDLINRGCPPLEYHDITRYWGRLVLDNLPFFIFEDTCRIGWGYKAC